jgi:hypothetical protein
MTDIPNQTNHSAENEETIQNVDVIKRPRGRPKKEVIPVEKRPQGRPRINPPKEKQSNGKVGRKAIYEPGTIGKPKDPDYWKTYYQNVVKQKRNAKRLVPLEVPSEVPLE